jgi:hypothetical protein
MANVDAFNSGFDMGSGKKSPKKKTGEKDGQDSGKATGLKGYLGKKFGKHNNSPKQFSEPEEGPVASAYSFHKGGTVKKTGNYRLRKGEKVLTISQQKAAGIKKGGKKKANSRKRIASKG